MRAGLVRQAAENEWGNAVLCAALTCVDDTTLVSKTIGAELKERALTPVPTLPAAAAHLLLPPPAFSCVRLLLLSRCPAR